MGKASSNKKIARAQRAGGRAAAARERSLLFPVSVTLVVVLGVLLVVVARSGRDAEATEPPTLADHWHTAYGISICGVFQPPITNETDPIGIHTHGDGVIHVHPFSENAAGDNARLDDFLEASSTTLEDDELEIPSGTSVNEGDDDCDGEDAELRVARWASADTAEDDKPQIFTEDFGSIRFLEDREALTIFFGPADADIPPPPSIPQLDQLTDIAPPSAPPAPGHTPEPTAPPEGDGEPSETTDTTAPAAGEGEPSDTTAPEESTTTTAGG